jgi:putative transposase
LTEQGLKLSRIGTLRIRNHREIKGKIKACIIKREIDKWYACFSVEYESVQKAIPEKAIGIDVGIKSFAVHSEGEVIENPKYLRKSEERLILKQRQFSKKKGSENRKKARIKVAKLQREVRNQRSDFHHKVSRRIVDPYGFIGVEDLNIKGMVRNHHFAKSISDAGWGSFSIILHTKRWRLVVE